MSWLRLDDGFTKHPKFEGWTPAEKWAWLEVMEYCARYNTRGRIPTDHDLLPRSATPKLIAKAENALWCERREDGALWVNDWDEYNPPRYEEGELETRVRQALEDQPGASANQISKAVGARKQDVLRVLRRFRAGSHTGYEPVDNGSHASSGNQAGTGPARAYPSRPQREPLQGSLSGPDQPATTPPKGSVADHDKTITLARLVIQNIGHELPADDLPGALRVELGPARYEELTDDDLIQLANLHADLLERAAAP